jgi:hypothetical protein
VQEDSQLVRMQWVRSAVNSVFTHVCVSLGLVRPDSLSETRGGCVVHLCSYTVRVVELLHIESD